MKLYAFILIMGWSFLMVGCSEEETVKEEIIRPVRYLVVGNSDGGSNRTYSGTAKAGDEIELSFRSGGVLVGVNVKKGQRVKKGDLIARLDNVEAELDFEKSKAELRSAESSLNTNQSELNRSKSLYEKNSISLSEYQSAKNNYQSALSQYQLALRNKQIKEQQIKYGFIYAPKDGVIASTNGRVNERVSAGHVFAELNAGEQIKVALGIPENVINKVLVGMETSITFSSLPDQAFKGSVLEVSPVVTENSSTYPVDIAIETPSQSIRPGMAAQVSFHWQSDADQGNRVMVPVKTVGEDGGGNFVFLIEKDGDNTGIARKTYVEVGRISDSGFEIKKGLNNGDWIATAGIQTLLDGQKVKFN
ncbi:efflux RND transporter periplasmic adaptor subunit [bacterium SCSIO 12741]|nr:efflux RND transporter periplasmic adaptor subunit [bacterium SCSIO 12741]